MLRTDVLQPDKLFMFLPRISAISKSPDAETPTQLRLLIILNQQTHFFFGSSLVYKYSLKKTLC